MSLSEPFGFFIQLHLTARCNLRCRHCYQERPGGAELAVAEIRELIAEVREALAAWREAYGVPCTPAVSLTGGEPFLREDLAEITREFRAAGFAVSILTNGTLLSREDARRLAGLGVSAVQVSLEGREEAHDGIRGAGSFAAAVQGVDDLVAAGIPVTANMTLSRLNAAEVLPLAHLVASRGVQRLGFARIVPAGRGCELREAALSVAETRRLYREIAETRVPGLEFVTGDPVASCLLRPPKVDPSLSVAVGGCAAGLAGITVLEDGTLLPCRRLPVPIGNIRRDSLREVWAASPVLLRLRDRDSYRGRCGSCARWAACRGCRAIAWAASLADGAVDLCADDPQCFHGQAEV
jgi:radical SAM protein with 4Fe4S-binding SPASM domain